MIILNCTPHEVKIVDETGDIQFVFKTSGTIPRVTSTDEQVGEIEGIGVPLIRQKFGEVTDLPERKEDTILIVSAMVKAAKPDRDDLVSPAQFVRDDKGQIIGCKALAY